LEVSAYSLVALAQRAEKMMPRGGAILAMTAIGGERVLPNYNVMGVAKAALESCVRYLANDLGPQGIRVNAVSAGPIKTLSAAGVAGFKAMYHQHERVSPMRGLVTQEDVGQAAVWLCSDQARMVTGQVVYVDSGWSILGFTGTMDDIAPGKES
jgi:enoyl-[acyl-carrier protein] reductase I